MNKKTLYLASPYGFTSSGMEFMKNKLVPTLKQDFKIMNPWDALSTNQKNIKKIFTLDDPIKKFDEIKKLNNSIAKQNLKLLDDSDMVLAVLDGSDVDSGVASEIGYAYAKGKRIVGYRSDFRLTGDNIGTTVNIQVEFFINRSGGIITSDLKNLFKFLQTTQKSH